MNQTKITEKTIRDSIENDSNFSKGNQKDEEKAQRTLTASKLPGRTPTWARPYYFYSSEVQPLKHRPIKMTLKSICLSQLKNFQCRVDPLCLSFFLEPGKLTNERLCFGSTPATTFPFTQLEDCKRYGGNQHVT